MEPAEIEMVLIDWAGTITVPMRQMMHYALEHLEWDDETQQRALAGFATYFDEGSIFHQAERGEIDDSELLAWMEEQAPGGSALMSVDEPSFINAPDRPEMIDLMWWLQEVDVSVVMATNNFASAQDLLASRYLDPGLVHAIVNSALVGARKPEPKFWSVILEAFDIDPSAIVLLDDNETNLASADSLGMHTIAVGDDAAPAIAELKALLAPSAA